MIIKIKPEHLRKGDTFTLTARYAAGDPKIAYNRDGEAVISLEDGTRLIIPSHAEMTLEHRAAPDLSQQPLGAVIKVASETGAADTWMKTKNGWGDIVWVSQSGRSRAESAFAHEELRTSKWEVFL